MADYTDKPGYSFSPGPPPEASRYLANKGLRPSFGWADVEPEEHAVAFTAAKAMQVDVLTAIREEVQRALDDGVPFAQFQRELRPRLQELGWWGVKDMTDPETGEVLPVQLGSPRRLRTIYRANLRTARAAGQWERIERTRDALPFLEYRLGPSERHRQHHVDKSGLVLPADDPFWDSWFPPNGWNCRCWVRQLTRPAAEAAGIDEAPRIPDREVQNRRTGEVRRVPVGIDPGWDRNPGKLRARNAEAFLAGRLDGAEPDIARAAARDIAGSWRVARLLDGSATGQAPVAMLPAAAADRLGASARAVMLDTATARQLTDDGIGQTELDRLDALLHDGTVAPGADGGLRFSDAALGLAATVGLARGTAENGLWPALLALSRTR